MYALLVAAGNFLIGFLLRGATIKFVILSAVAYLFGWLLDVVTSAVDISPLSGVQSFLDSMPQAVLFFMGLCRLDLGIPIVLGAMATKFLIRRLPVIG